ncbi:MAG: acyltransferase family protein [Spirochaetaceae bacterium]|jgi:peptidoglycan/LPS O-acetylase OafA/YrhL|nr:acyltransferase family protein [Spirochaetaceae bacterium]
MKRLVYLDNLRSLVTGLVVVIHSAITYSGIGSWYYIEGEVESLNLIEKAVFGLLQSFVQAWFMGVLFFTAAFFAAVSLAKRGPGAFIRERTFRLGVPLLVYLFVIAPVIYFALLKYDYAQGSILGNYLLYLTSFEWLGSTGPLWFSETLLFFCAAYALFRRVHPRTAAAVETPKPPSAKTLALIILGTGIGAFTMRIIFPIGTDVLNLQFCFFVSYMVLFILGIMTGERGWLFSLAGEKNIRWFILVPCAGIPVWVIIMIAGGILRGDWLIYGGLHWQSAAYSLWEAFTAVGFSIGLIAFFKKHAGTENGFTRFFAANSFGIYVLHPPILIFLSLLFQSWKAPPLLKFPPVSAAALILSLGCSALLRLIPPVRAILK